MGYSYGKLLKNVNFDLRIVECVVCLVGTILASKQYIFGTPGTHPVNGWFMISLAYLVAYNFERPNFWLEALSLVGYLCYFSIDLYLREPELAALYICPAYIVVILMFVDLCFLICNKK